MIYFSLTMSRDELSQIGSQVDPTVFCLWHEGDEENLFGVIKDSAYELFIVACSLLTVQSMKWLTLLHLSQSSNGKEKVFVCGNRNLL